MNDRKNEELKARIWVGVVLIIIATPVLFAGVYGYLTGRGDIPPVLAGLATWLFTSGVAALLNIKAPWQKDKE